MIIYVFTIFSAVEMWGEQTLRQQFGHGEDKRVKNEDGDQWAISKSREDLIDSMLNLIVNHKKSLKLIPQCSHIDTATEWAAKRGLSASSKDLDNDGTPETVVWDKSGRYPYVVNGYQLARSDYPTRNQYWGTHKTSESRAEEPMDDWVRNKVYNVKTKADNKWVVDSVDMTEVGHKIDKFGYGMPTRPKKMMTPYAIFSKLIAPIVKEVWRQDAFYKAFGITNHGEASYTAELFRKIISPISIYRALYLRLVEQKYYFKQCDAIGGNPIEVAAFKKWMKVDRNKANFYNWFYTNYLAGADKSEFNKEVVDMDKVIENLVPPPPSDGKPRNIDVLFHLLGAANWTDTQPFLIDHDSGQTYTLQQVLKNDALAEVVFGILNDKDHPNYRTTKKNLERAKKISQASSEKFIGKANLESILNDKIAYDAYRKSVAKTGTPNHVVPPSPAPKGNAEEQHPEPGQQGGRQQTLDEMFS